VIEPEEEEQSRVVEAIFGKEGIKAGFTSGAPKDMIVNVSRELIARGAEAIIAGCTEVPLVLKDRDISVPLIEPMRIMAEKSIKEAGYDYIG
jgi:aspartate racemase